MDILDNIKDLSDDELASMWSKVYLEMRKRDSEDKERKDATNNEVIREYYNKIKPLENMIIIYENGPWRMFDIKIKNGIDYDNNKKCFPEEIHMKMSNPRILRSGVTLTLDNIDEFYKKLFVPNKEIISPKVEENIQDDATRIYRQIQALRKNIDSIQHSCIHKFKISSSDDWDSGWSEDYTCSICGATVHIDNKSKDSEVTYESEREQYGVE